MNFFGIGPAEAGLVLVIALIVIGPQRFPEVMRHAGRWYRVARAYSNEVMKDVRAAVDEIEREVKTETDDLREVGEMANLRADLKEAREAAEDVHRDTRAAAAGSPDPIVPPPAPPSTNAASASATSPVRPSARPSSPSGTAPASSATGDEAGRARARDDRPEADRPREDGAA